VAAAKIKNLKYSQTLRYVLNKVGPMGVWRGITPPVVLRGGSFGIMRFSMTKLESSCRYYFPANDSFYRRWEPWVLGGSAGLINAVVENPIHLLKNRGQNNNSTAFQESLAGYVRATSDLFHTQGPRALLRGVVPGICFGVGSWSVFWGVDHQLKEHGSNPLVAGPVSAVVSWSFFYPLDVIRTRMQVGASPPPQYSSSRTRRLRANIRPLALSSLSSASESRHHFPPVLTHKQQQQLVAKKLDFVTHFIAHFRQPVNLWFPALGLTVIRAVPRFAIQMTMLERCNHWMQDCGL
jgi:hypothetical protein